MMENIGFEILYKEPVRTRYLVFYSFFFGYFYKPLLNKS